MKDEFFMAIYLFFNLVLAICGLGTCIYGICILAEWWLRLLCWFGSIVCLAGTILVIVTIKSTYFDEE